MTYKELYEKRRLKYAREYESALANKDIEKAYAVLGKLMKYRMIEPEDALVSKKNLKLFEKAGIDPEHRFPKDYRKDTHFLPDNLFFDVPNYMMIDIVAEKHWGKQIELGYEGDIIIPEKTYRYEIRERARYSDAMAAYRGMKELYKKETRNDLNVDWKEAIEYGHGKMYEVMLSFGQQFIIPHLGYAYVTITNARTLVVIMLKNTDIIKNYINIKKAYTAVMDAIVQGLVENGMSVDKIEVKPLCNIKKLRELQVKKNSKQPPLDYNKFCEIENAKLAAQAAKEASNQ